MNNITAQRVFSALDAGGRGWLKTSDIIDCLREAGLDDSDRRVQELSQHMSELADGETIDSQRFHSLVDTNFSLVERAAKSEFVIPQFSEFRENLHDIFEKVSANERSGSPHVALSR